MVGLLNEQSWYECSQCDYKNKYPFNLEYHMKCHTRNQRIKCPLCSFSSNFQFYLDRHLELHHANIQTPQGKHSIGTNNKTKLVALWNNYDEPGENSLNSFCTTNEAAGLNLNKASFELEAQKIELEEVDCRKRISQCKEDIRMARICMAEMRAKVKQQREIRSDKQKQKEILSHCLELIRNNNRKLSKLLIETKALETLRSNIRNTNRRKIKFKLQLRSLQLKDLESKMYLNESVDEVVVIESNDGAIESLKSRIKRMKNELNILQEKERILARDVELMNQSLHVVVVVPEQVVQGLQLEIEELEKEIRKYFQDQTEDALNQLIISTEKKISRLFELKNTLFDIIFMKKSIRRISGLK